MFHPPLASLPASHFAPPPATYGPAAPPLAYAAPPRPPARRASGAYAGPPRPVPVPSDPPLTAAEGRALAAHLAPAEPVLAYVRGYEFDVFAFWAATPERVVLVEWLRLGHEAAAVPYADLVSLDVEREEGGDAATLWMRAPGGVRALLGANVEAGAAFVARVHERLAERVGAARAGARGRRA